MHQTEYRFLFRDAVTGDIQGEAPFVNASYADIYNAPGAFTGVVNLRQPTNVATMMSSCMDLLDLGRLQVFVERDGVLMWGGWIWTSDTDIEAGTCTLSGEGYLSYFRRRVIPQTLTYTGVDQTTIAKGLIDTAQATSGYGDVGVVTADVGATGVLRDRVYDFYETKYVGDALEDLAAVEGGFIFRFEPRWNSGIEVRFLTTYPSEGRSTDHVFELGQMSVGRVRRDATTLATRVTATGATLEADDHALTGVLWNTPALASVPLLDDVVTYSDVNVIQTLIDHATRRLNAGERAMVIPEVEVNPDQDPSLGSYIIGDQVTVRASFGFEEVDDLLKIIERRVTVDDSGTERVALSFSNLTPPMLRYSSQARMHAQLSRQRLLALAVNSLEKKKQFGGGSG